MSNEFENKLEQGKKRENKRYLSLFFIFLSLIYLVFISTSLISNYYEEKAFNLFKQQNYKLAEKSYKKAIFLNKYINNKNLNKNILLTNKLADLYIKEKKYQEAEIILKNNIEFISNKFNLNSSLIALALIYEDQNKYSESEKILKLAIDVNENLSNNQELSGFLMYNLAGIYKKQAKFKKAEEFYKKSINVNIKKFGNNDPSNFHTLQDLSDLYIKMNKPKLAQIYKERALKLLEVNKLSIKQNEKNN